MPAPRAHHPDKPRKQPVRYVRPPSGTYLYTLDLYALRRHLTRTLNELRAAQQRQDMLARQLSEQIAENDALRGQIAGARP